jgi:hypothetical protein
MYVDWGKAFAKSTQLYTFYDLLTGYSTLSSIQKLFESKDILTKEFYVSVLSGQRRSLADSYVSSIDLENSRDIRKLFYVIEMFYLKFEENEYFQQDTTWKQFLKLLERDGYVFEN